MKKHFLMFLAAAATFSMSACSNDDQEIVTAAPDQENTIATPESKTVQITFTAGMGNGATSKTTIAGDKGLDLWFQKGDEIVIVDGNGEEVTATAVLPDGKETSPTCTFTATFSAGTQGPYNAYYYWNDWVYAWGLYIFDWSDIQSPVAGSFDPKFHIMTATATDNELEFRFETKNSFVKFTAPCDLKLAELTASNGEVLNGNMSLYEGSIGGTYDSDFNSRIRIEQEMHKGETYYISVVPQKFAKGSLKLTLTSTSNVTKTYTVDKEFTAKANKVYTFSKIADLFEEKKKVKCANLETFLNSPDYYDGVSICLEDYNGGYFDNNPIRDENKKVTIILPNELTSIGARAFSRCYSLTEVVIPEGVQSIGDNAFYECYNLKSINIPSSVTTLGGGVFSGCKSLATLTIDVETIPSRFFYNMGSLTYVVLGDNVKTICSNAFEGCSGIKSMTIGKSVTTVESGALKGIEGEIHLTQTLKSKIEREYYRCTLIADVPEN